MKFTALALAAALCLVTTAPVRADDAEPDHATVEMMARLRVIENIYARLNSPVHAQAEAFGVMASGRSQAVPATIEAGAQYSAVAVCDDNCRDIDLRVVNSAGEVLVADEAHDTHPIIQFEATSSGPIQVEAVMSDCSSAACNFGVKFYWR